MNLKTLKSDALLLITAAIWGLAFVAQRVGMDYIGPFLYNGVRFALGSLALLPFALQPKSLAATRQNLKAVLIGGLVAGVTLFIGSSFQQVGLIYTTAGHAGFITGLYVVLVPLIGVLLKHKIFLHNWIGTALAILGLFLLTVRPPFTVNKGDLYVLVSPMFYALHVHIIGWLTTRVNAGPLAFIQYATCSVLSMIIALGFEPINFSAIWQAAIPILYGGLMSVGVAYSLQIVGQRFAPPSHAAILLSMESVFAVLGGLWIIHETLSIKGIIGCTLMFLGMIVSQIGRGLLEKKLLTMDRIRDH